MSSFTDAVLAESKKKIKDTADDYIESVIGYGVATEEYKLYLGRIQGLRNALDIMNDVEQTIAKEG